MTDPAYLAALLEAWLPARRWYATKNLAPRIESVVVAPAHGSRARRLADAGTEILEVFVTDRPARDRIVYQVPLVRRRERPDVPESAVLGREREGGWLIDAPWDSEYMIWLAGADEGGIDITETRVVTGEQSNTSVICEVTEGPFDIIIKIFRVLAEGSNPDAELQQALTRAGVRRVPRFVDAGWGSWTRGHSSEYGHLSVTSEYIDDADDAWGLATTAAAE
ncbi:MAG TPA: hypothetical protein VFC82_11570, partial [Actinomycetaceae bacterium]|nr:hypothetical protein [Actinomycetaceae bacterium]